MKLRGLFWVLALSLIAVPAFADYTVYVGYADSLRPSGFFPNPWSGSPNTTFIGNTGINLDTGAIMIVNSGAVDIFINSISYQQWNGVTYNLWGAPGTLHPGDQLIVDQTAFYNFDSSDSDNFMPAPDFALGPSAIGGCNDLTAAYTAAHISGSNLAAVCAAHLGTVTITVDTVATAFTDSGFILDTGGYDFVYYSADGNESINWSLIGTHTDRSGNVPEPSSLVLLAGGLVGVGSRAWKRFIR